MGLREGADEYSEGTDDRLFVGKMEGSKYSDGVADSSIEGS